MQIELYAKLKAYGSLDNLANGIYKWTILWEVTGWIVVGA